ncbi:helix-turn-helix domain-containing protein [Cupriavidus basilensis]
MRNANDAADENAQADLAGPKGIASVETAVRLLRVVEASPQPLTLKEIAGAVGFSSSKAHHYLVSLVRSGLLERADDGQRYLLGSFSLQLGLTSLARSGTANVVADAVRALRDETGHA